MSSYNASICLLGLALISCTVMAGDKSLGQTINQTTSQTTSQTMSPSLGQPLESYQGSIVSPDGDGLPIGSGSVVEGKGIFEKRCIACHGLTGEQPGNQLVGGLNSLPTMRPLKTVGSFWPYATTLYDYVARAMPYNEEKSLTPDEVYAVTAYVLNLNQIIDSAKTLDQDNLAEVKMPNRDGFIELIH